MLHTPARHLLFAALMVTTSLTFAADPVKVDVIKNPYGGSRNVPELSINPDYIHAAESRRLYTSLPFECLRVTYNIDLTF